MSTHTNIIASYLSGNISSDDQRALNEWLKESEANRQEFQKLKKYWELSQSSKKKHEYQTQVAWQDFVELRKQPTRTKGYSYLKLAAVFVLLLVSAYVIRYLFFNESAAGREISAAQATSLVVQEPVEEMAMFALYAEDSARMFILPDKSKVYLNKNSTLQYPENFMGKERTSYLTGEAFFEVRPDSIPFVVNCGGIQTRVLGTSFWLRSGNDNKVELSVSSGSVEVSGADEGAAKVIVQKNEKIKYTPAAPFFSKEKSNGTEHKWTEKMSLGKKIKRFIQRFTKKKKQ
jgi:transmembrane sensor